MTDNDNLVSIRSVSETGKSPKTPAWTRIKAEYLQGVTPKELVQKYKISAKQVSDKAYLEDWAVEKSKILEKTRKNTEEKIADLICSALDTLGNVINDKSARNSDKIAACRAILDISGLKSSKQEVTGANGESVAVQKIYITPEEAEEARKHIYDVINGK